LSLGKCSSANISVHVSEGEVFRIYILAVSYAVKYLSCAPAIMGMGDGSWELGKVVRNKERKKGRKGREENMIYQNCI